MRLTNQAFKREQIIKNASQNLVTTYVVVTVASPQKFLGWEANSKMHEQNQESADFYIQLNDLVECEHDHWIRMPWL